MSAPVPGKVTGHDAGETLAASALAGLTAGVLDAIPDAVIIADRVGQICSVNQAAARIFGWPAAELAGQAIDCLIPDHLRAVHRGHMAAFAGDKKASRFMGERAEIVGLRRNGEVFPAEASITRVEQAGGPLFVAILRDISERKAEEAASRERERRFHAVFDLTYQFAGLLSPAGEVLAANRAALQFSGVKIDDLRGRLLADTRWFAGSEEARAIVRQGVELAAGGEFNRNLLSLRGANGRRLTVDFSLKPIFDERGAVTMLIAEGRDITDVVSATKALERREAELRRAQQIARIGSWSWNVRTGEVNWSDEVYRIYGQSKPAFGATFPDFLELVHPDDRESVKSEIEAALKGEASYENYSRIIRPDGSIRILYREAEVIRDEDGAPLVLEGIVQDVTERRQAEEELLSAYNAAQAANAAKSRFLAMMGHELRTPLNAIIGFSEMVAGEAFGDLGDDRYREYIDHILSAGRHLHGMLESVLAASHAEQGRIAIEEERVAVAELISSSVRIIDPGLAVDSGPGERALICTDVPEGLPDLLVDERLMRQVLLNLIGNALKFSPDEERVEISVVRNGAGLGIVVEDHGRGIDPQTLARLTEPFYQADDSLRRRHEGMGLGLYLVRHYLELHGGRLEIASEPGQGTRATAWFPASRLLQTERKRMAAAPAATGAS